MDVPRDITQARRWFDPTWIELSRYGQNSLLKTSYFWLFIVPVLARLLSQLPEQAALVFGDQTFVVNFRLPFSWQMMFVASLLLSAASLIFGLHCPPLVRDYADLESFKSEGRTATQTVWFLKQHWTAQGMNREQREAEGRNFLKVHEVSTGSGGHYAENLSFENAFHDARQKMCRSASGWRKACCALFVLGFTVVGFIVLENILYVVRYACR